MNLEVHGKFDKLLCLAVAASRCIVPCALRCSLYVAKHALKFYATFSLGDMSEASSPKNSKINTAVVCLFWISRALQVFAAGLLVRRIVSPSLALILSLQLALLLAGGRSS